MSLKSAKSRSLARHSSRGVAMVEAAVVVPVLSIFFGLFVFVHAEYAAKEDSMWNAEYSTWDYAAHGCVGNEDVQPQGTNPYAQDANATVEKAPNDPAHSFIGNFTARMLGESQIVNRQATSDAKWSKYKRTVVSNAWAFCNEPNYEADHSVITALPTFLFSYGRNFLQHNR